MPEKLHDHHLCHYRKSWEANEDNKWIRRRGGLLLPMLVDVHADLHRDTPGVPPLDIFAARRVRAILVSEGVSFDPAEAVERFCFAVEDAIRHPKAHPIEIASAELTVAAMRLQLPYLREGSPGFVL